MNYKINNNSTKIENRIIDRNSGLSNIFNVLPIVNFVLSLLIVIHHSFNIVVDYNVELKTANWVLQRFLYNISECAVPIFFFISAILFFRNYSGSKEEYIYKIKRRFFSIIIPYVLFNILGYLKHIIYTGNQFRILGLIRSIIICDTMPLWFLRELFILVLLTPAIFYIKKHFCFTVIMSSIISVFVVLGTIRYRSFLYWLPVYMIGSSIKVEKMHDVALWFKRRKLQYFIFLITPIFAWLLPNTTSTMDYIGNAIYYSYRIFSVLLGILVIGLLQQKSHKVYWFMHYSFWVYCVHFPLISLYGLLFGKMFNTTNELVLLLKYVSTIVIVYIVSVILGLFLKTFFPPVWKVLNGGR